MKIINPERQNETGSTASSTDSDFPLANIFDNHPRNVWKADSTNEATLRLKIKALSNTLALFGTNADDVICTITKDEDEQNIDNAAAVDKGGGKVGIPCIGHGYSTADEILLNGTTNYDGVQTVDATSSDDEIVITATYAAENFAGTETVAEVQDTETFDLQVVDTYGRFFADDPKVYRRFWMDYTYQLVACTATIKLSAATGDIVNAGTFKAGTSLEYPNVKYDLTEGRKSYGIKKRMNNASLYGRTRNIVRLFSCSVLLKRSFDATDQYYIFMDVYDQFGEEQPFAALLVDDENNLNWSVYCTFAGISSNPGHSPKYALVKFDLEEEV